MVAQGKAHPMWQSSQVAVLVLLPLICILVLYVSLFDYGSAQNLAVDAIHKEALSQMEDGSRSILPINVSAVRLARLLSSSRSRHLEKQIAHDLFIFYSIVPHLSKVSYFQEDGLFFAYHNDGNRDLVLFSNISISPSTTNLNRMTNVYRWYHQEVDEITGTPHGQAVEREPVAYWTSSWFHRALLSDHDRATWLLEWSDQQPLFTCIVPVRGSIFRGRRGVVAVGVPVKVLLDFLSPPRRFHGSSMFLGAKDRKLGAGSQFYNSKLHRWVPRELMVDYRTVDGNDQLDILLHMQNGDSNMKNEPASVVFMNVQDRRYTLHTAHFKLFELPLVSTLTFPHGNITYHGSKESNLKWFLRVFLPIVLSLMTCFYAVVASWALRTIVLLRASLIKQIEATRQEERKSMNKTIAFASTCHDVRTILAAMLGLLDHCISNVSDKSELHSSLTEIKSFSLNLLGILNSVLDISKIEAGKMELEEVEYDIAQALEDVVDMFYVSAMKKGVEVVLDPCDGTIQKYSRVKGDYKKFQEILYNLLSNAVKFTSEGHIMVRAWAKQASSKNLMLPLNENGHDLHFWHYLSPCYWCNRTSNMGSKFLEGDINEENMIEVVIEVDDIGKGILNEKHKSVFKSFLQVKEVDSGNYGGIGLGLGIIHSLARLMGGEINIVDKVPSAGVTCFRFNTIMKAAESSINLKNNEEHDHELLSVLVDQPPYQPEIPSKESNLKWFLHFFLSVALSLMTCFYAVVASWALRTTVLLRASLIEQIEATRQAERKSMNKTVALASTSHDMRTIISAMLDLLDHCISKVSQKSELGSYLVEIKSFSLNLLGILNSVLDISKIEAGKVQLEEVEYDIAQALEDVVDMFYVSAMKKGVEVVLDPCDGTLQKYSRVKGDYKRFQEILCNLLSNAVKFTSEGHIMVRAWAKQASFLNSMLPLNEIGHGLHFWHYLSPSYWCSRASNMGFKSLPGEINDETMIEIVIEVDDTGKGIPKDKHKLVFESFVQVTEVDSGTYGGIGLGLGIVQSLVRLMGGEINIVEKAPSAKGTCFRFNIIMKATESSLNLKNDKEVDHELLSVLVDQPPYQPEIPSTTDLAFSEDFDLEGTCAILLLKCQARTVILKKWMEEHRLKVYVLDDLEKLHFLLDTLKPKACSVATTYSEIVSDDGADCTETVGISSKWKHQELDSATSDAINDGRLFFSTMRKRSGRLEKLHSLVETLKPKGCSVTTTCSEIISDDDGGHTETSRCSCKRNDQEIHSTALHTINDNHVSSSRLSRRSCCHRIMSFRAAKCYTNLLFIIEMDHHSDPLLRLSKMLSNFILNAQEFKCKVVWLAGGSTRSMDVEALKKSESPCDLIFHKPLHGSRLYQTLGLVYDTGRGSKGRQATGMNSFRDPQPYNIESCATDVRSHFSFGSVNTFQWLPDSSSTAFKILSGHGDKPLKGFKILAVDDNVMLLRLMTTTLSRLGATVESSKNGEDAFFAVRRCLQGLVHDHREDENSHEVEGKECTEKMLYDIIFMDCEMPTMDGYEATRKIREEEKHYSDVHIPIIALTAHAMAAQKTKSLQSGMDFHLVKPVSENELLDAIRKVLKI